MTTGLGVVLYGTLRDDLARTLGGTCLALIALTVIALILIRSWIVDTSQERRILGASQREAQRQRDMYFAAQAALEVEQGRLNQDRAAERRADIIRLQAERKAMEQEFEDRRATVIAETMEATILMMRSGDLDPAPSTTGRLIPFPHQQAQPHPERARSREKGVVGP